MKNYALILLTLGTLTFNSIAGEHGGGNGGSDLEMELKKTALQIGAFINSDMGEKYFPVLNPKAVIKITNDLDIDVVTGSVYDKYGTPRTCINEPDRNLITCESAKIVELMKKPDVYVATIFHEILGLMKVELGNQDNVSMYPISSQILRLYEIVQATPISEAQITPEFFGLDKRSYGITLVNKDTQESVRMICLNSNVEIHRCRNYSVVRNAQDLQAPITPNLISISLEKIKRAPLNDLTQDDLNVSFWPLYNDTRFELVSFKKNHETTPVSIESTYDEFKLVEYERVYHSGGSYQPSHTRGDHLKKVSHKLHNDLVIWYFLLGTETKYSKEISLSYIIQEQKKWWGIEKFNKNLERVRLILNKNNDLAIVGKSVSVKDEDYKKTVNLLEAVLQDIK